LQPVPESHHLFATQASLHVVTHQHHAVVSAWLFKTRAYGNRKIASTARSKQPRDSNCGAHFVSVSNEITNSPIVALFMLFQRKDASHPEFVNVFVLAGVTDLRCLVKGGKMSKMTFLTFINPS